MPTLRRVGQIPTEGIQDDAITSAKIKDGEIVNADISALAAIVYEKLVLTGKIVNADIKSDAAIAYSKLATDPQICRIKTGTYTGDGAATKAITGIGFKPKAVLIFMPTAGYCFLYFKNDQMGTPSVFIRADYNTYENDIIISLDDDGFTIGDTLEINTNGKVFPFTCWG